MTNETTTVKCLTVYLAGNEWGNTVMLRLATEALTSRKRPAGIKVVTVFEHGGWWLEYAIVGGLVTVINSANGGARFSPEVEQWHRDRAGRKWESLGSIRREQRAGAAMEAVAV